MAKEQNKIDELNQALYSRTRYQDPLDKRSVVRELNTSDVDEKWQTPGLDDLLMQERQAMVVKPFVKKLFIFSLTFFVIAILVATFVFLGGSTFVSSKNVDISIVGPTMVSAGEILDLGIGISNRNNTDLELANFSVQYPQGSRDSSDTSKSLTYNKESLGAVKAGDEIARNVRFVLLGSTGETKEVKLSVEYKVKGSNATFFKDKIYLITIGDTPLTLLVDSPKMVVSGENFTTTLNITLNSAEVLKNAVLRAEYPYGFSVVSSNPEVLSGDNAWALGDIPPGGTKKVTIQGKLLGEDREERTFRFYVGVSENDSPNPNFKTVVLSAQKTLSIERSSVGLNVSFNGDSSPTFTIPAEQLVSTFIRFQNNLSEKLLNPQIEVKLFGQALNKTSIFVQNRGTYNPDTLHINWSPVNNLGLPELAPGDSESVSFSLASMPETLISGDSEISVQITLSATPIGENKPIIVSETRIVRVSSQINVSARAAYSVGSFANTGPVPPKVDQETTYTVVLSLGNVESDINNAKVTAKLGSKVKWMTAKADSTEKVSYDEKTNIVTWDIDRLVSGVGLSGQGREVSFQLALTPSSTQVGSVPVLVNNIVFSGKEVVSRNDVLVNVPNVTTRLSNDPAFIQGDDIVVK